MSERIPEASTSPPMLEYATAAPQPRWRRTIRVLLWIEIAASAIAAFACFIEVESILGTGPALLFIGLLLLIFGQLARKGLVLAAGIEPMCVVVAVFALINLRNWSPREAQLPVSVIAFVHAICVAVLATLALLSLRGGDVVPTAVPFKRRQGDSNEL